MANNNFGDENLEKLERGVKSVVNPVKQVASDMFTDALKSLTGNYGQQVEQNQPPVQTQQVAQDEAKKLQETRANLAQINREVAQARQKREQKQQQVVQVQQEKTEEKKKVVEQQKKESVLSKIIKSRQGSKESMQRASG